jgi:hypothetical protein
MAAIDIPKTPVRVLEKLQQLLGALQSVRAYSERMAVSIPAKEFKFSVLELAQEARQYSNELIAHIEVLGGELADSYKEACNNIHRLADYKSFTNGKDELTDVTLGEKFILKMYREVLNEPFLLENSRKMIRYQQNGIMCLLSKLKMMKSSLKRTL